MTRASSRKSIDPMAAAEKQLRAALCEIFARASSQIEAIEARVSQLEARREIPPGRRDEAAKTLAARSGPAADRTFSE